MNQMIEQPVAQGNYRPAVRHSDIIYTSGMTPRSNGKLLYSGKICASDAIEAHRDAVQLATRNALIAAQAHLAEGENISMILQLNVFLNTEQGFLLHPKLADYASDFLIEELGATSIGSRAAIGVATLPSDAPVEVTLTAAVAVI